MKAKHHPQIFTAESVRAIFDRRKTQTRRVVSPVNSLMDGRPVERDYWAALEWSGAWVDQGPSPAGNPGPYWQVPRHEDGERIVHRIYPRVFPGDLLWVKETWALVNGRYLFRADDGYPDPVTPPRWKSPIHMPRAASRITLGVIRVKAERVQDISQADAIAEGCDGESIVPGPDPLVEYSCLWNDINAKRGFDWDSNPPVWVYEWRNHVKNQN